VEMLLHEARLAAQLNHPNVVQTYEVTSDGGLPVIVMEYLEGQPLSQVAARVKGAANLPLAMHLTVLCDVLAGLHHAHELNDFEGAQLNLVHRDVSPDNVFVTFEGQVKLLDFGIAKVTTCAPGETGAGVVKGKVRYMAPEQMDGSDVDRRADVYAVGALLWEALAGERIWNGVSDVAVMHSVAKGEIPSPKTRNPDVQARLERVCVKAMSPEPADRYATAQEFQFELEAALAELGTAVRARDIGQWVATRFAEPRAKIRAIVEAEMNRIADLTPSTRTELRATSLPKLGLLAIAQSIGGGGSGAHASPRTAARRRRWPLVVVAVGLVAAAIAITVSGRRSHAVESPLAATATADLSAASTLTPATVPAPIQTVRVIFSATPPQARLFFDGELLPDNPATLVRPRDAAPHSVRASSAGYATRSADVSLDHDGRIALDLERQAVRPSPKRDPQPAAPTATATAASPGPAKPNCAVPYYFDERGIKKIRDECL